VVGLRKPVLSEFLLILSLEDGTVKQTHMLLFEIICYYCYYYNRHFPT